MCCCSPVCVCGVAPVQMEREHVVAPEPVFSAGPSAQLASHIPAVPNGSGAPAKPSERCGKLTAEQLAAIEDEELLDKMVLNTRVIIQHDLEWKAIFSLAVMQKVCVLTLNDASYVRTYLDVPAWYCVYAPCHLRAACINRAMLLWLLVRNDLIVSFHSLTSQKTLRRGR